jgi:hypothetical protein
MYGYLQPCGCSRPQVGGLERRYELLQRLQRHGYALSAADLGDLHPKGDPSPQSRWKYEVAVKSLKSMGYAALALGPTEFAMPLNAALDQAQNYQPPIIVAANLLDPELQFPDMFRGWALDDPRRPEDPAAVVGRLTAAAAAPLGVPTTLLGTLLPTGRPRVGYFGWLGESVIDQAKKKDTGLKFAKAEEVFSTAVTPFLAARPELRVLLFQGTAEEAERFLDKHPQVFQVVLCRNDADDGVAPILPQKHSGGGWIIMVGHKGKAAGLVAFRRGQPLRYRLEEMVEGLELPDAQTNPAREIMKEYVWGVYRNNYLKDAIQTIHANQSLPGLSGASFVGSAKCQQCHPTSHQSWSASQHSHAWETLVKLGRPIAQVPQKDMSVKLIGRQFDADCVSCHVTGFGFKTGFENMDKTPYLFGNGCENCHGPGSLHANVPGNPAFTRPMRLDIHDSETERKCRICHDLDNDPHFDIKKWNKIKHGREGQVPRDAP